MKESQVEEQILSYLAYHGVYAWKNPTAGYYDPKRGSFRKQVSEYAINGVADILGILQDGTLLAIEVKSPDRKKKDGTFQKGAVSQDQEMFLENIHNNNGIAIVASSVEDVEKGLLSYDCKID